MAHLVKFFLGILTGIGLVKAFANSQKERSDRRTELAATIASFSGMTLEDLKKILPAENYPSWIAFTEYDKLNWLNLGLNKLWPFIDKAASEMIKLSVEPLLEHYKSSILASLKFSELTLGYVVPEFTGVRIIEDDKEGIIMEVEFQWDGNPSIILDVRTIIGVSLPIQVKDVGFTGVFRAIIKPLVDELPCIGAICFSLMKKKRIDFTLKIIGGDISSIPGVSTAIQETIHYALEDSITWPARKIIPVTPGDYSYLEMKPVGTLVVKLIQGRDLKNVDIVGKADFFARLYVRPLPDLMRTSKTINDDLNPLWNEHFEYVVEDASTQRLVVKIYDDNGIRSSELLGCAEVSLKDLQPEEVADLWLELVDNLDIKRESKYRGQVHLELAYCPIGMEHNFANPLLKGRLLSLNNAAEVEASSATSSENSVCQRNIDANISGSLSVTVLSTEDLPSSDHIIGESKFYLTVLLKESGVEYETTVVSGTLNPSWNQSFNFEVDDGLRELLLLEIWDEGILRKNYVGRCVLTLTRVLMEGETEGVYPIEGTSNGKLNLHLKWTPQTTNYSGDS